MTRQQIVETFIRVVGREPGHNDEQTIIGLVAAAHLTALEIEDFLRPLASPPKPAPVAPSPKPAPKPAAPPEPKPEPKPKPEPEPEPESEEPEELGVEPEPEDPEDEPGAEDITLDDLKSMKKLELAAMAKEMGIKGKFTKSELVKKIWRKLQRSRL